MTTEEKLKTYKEGYKDGYNDAVKFYINNPYLNTYQEQNRCFVCGKLHHVVESCTQSNCPIYTLNGLNKVSVSSNGAAGY